MAIYSEYSKRKSDCPALPICSIFGNAYNGCCVDAAKRIDGLTEEKCIVSLILLVARGQGLFTESMEKKLQERRQKSE